MGIFHNIFLVSLVVLNICFYSLLALLGWFIIQALMATRMEDKEKQKAEIDRINQQYKTGIIRVMTMVSYWGCWISMPILALSFIVLFFSGVT